MESAHLLEFSIDVFKPETIPMSRLAEYMAELAALYGSESHVHFNRLRSGSAILEVEVEAAAAPIVEQRLRQVHSAVASEDLKRIFHKLNQMLSADRAVGQIKSSEGEVILSFPGRHTQIAKTHRVKEAGMLDGVVIRIGGKDNTIPVWLKEASGVIQKCEATSDMARDLIHHYLCDPIRVTGQGEWLRNENGDWILEKFKIAGWVRLEQTELADIFGAAREQNGNDWNTLDDPIKEHLKLRGVD